MNNLNYSKDNLLKILRENRSRHRELFDKALDGYKTRLRTELDQRVSDLSAGRWRIQKHINLPEPIDQTKDYDAAIRMLELCTEDVIELEERDFRCYVMDEWSWKDQFLTTNNSYVG